jgi:Starch-binding associating with outer membrane
MKLNKLIYLVPLAVLVFSAGTGCRKGQFNINNNINNPTDSSVTYDVVLPAALNATGSIIARQWGSIQNWMSYWSRSGTYAPNVTEETYQITTGFGNGIWNNCYDNNYDYQIIQLKAHQAGADFYEGIARIMKAHNFQILVDVYGNVPYFQALKGSSNPTPAYDKGLDIYKDLLRQIDAGMLLINNAVVTTSNANKNIETNDIMFHGDKTLWQKFGNTLKLRMLIHTYAITTIDKTAEMAIITANGNGFLGAGQNAQVNPGYSGIDKGNPFYNQYITNTDGTGSPNNVYFKANKWGIDYYTFDGDPRIPQFYVAGTGGLIGVPYGTPPIAQYGAAVVAGIGPGVYKSATAPQCIFSAAESFFLQAEARQRNIITSGPTAQGLLLSAITESFAYMGAGSPTTYLANNATYPDVDYNGLVQGTGGPAGGLFTILSQKWFALNAINSLEVWTDWRRVPYSEVASKILTGNSAAPTDHFVYGDGGGFSPGPFRSVSPQITPADNIPVRLLYPQTEYNYNTANVAGQGTITRYSRVFWDLN